MTTPDVHDLQYFLTLPQLIAAHHEIPPPDISVQISRGGFKFICEISGRQEILDAPRCRVRGVRTRVLGLWFQSSGFRVEGVRVLGVRVWGLRFRV